MKSLTEHIVEKLRVNKNFVSANNFDFSKAGKIYILEWSKDGKGLDIDRYVVQDCYKFGTKPSDDWPDYEIIAKSEIKSLDVSCWLIEKYEILYGQNKNYYMICIHEDDKNMLTALLEFLNELVTTGGWYTLDYILEKKLMIKFDEFHKEDVSSISVYNRANTSNDHICKLIKNIKKDINK